MSEDRRRMMPAALICSVLANIHRDREKKPEPFTISDFVPDPDAQTDEENMIEFAEKVARGETFESTPEEILKLKALIGANLKTTKDRTPVVRKA